MVYSTTYASNNTQTGVNNPPVLSNEQPVNNATNVEITTSQVSVLIQDPDGDQFSWSIQGDYVNSSSASGASNGTKTAGLQIPLPYNISLVWYVNVSDGFNWTNATYSFHTRAQHTPDQPTSFIAYGYQTTQINLTWVKGINNVDRTYKGRYYIMEPGPIQNKLGWGRTRFAITKPGVTIIQIRFTAIQ
jgi:hypothetical protein